MTTHEQLFLHSPITYQWLYNHDPHKLPPSKKAARRITMETVMPIILGYFDVPITRLRQKTRKREVVQVRQIAMFMLDRYTVMTLKEIGQEFGGRDHTTVIHAKRIVQDLCDTDPMYLSDVENIEGQIKAL